MGSVKSNGWFVQLNKTTGGPYGVDEIRKLLDRGEIRPDSKVFSSRHPKEKITAIELVKMRSDPAYGLFEILRKARHKRDALRSRASERESIRENEKVSASEAQAEARSRRLVPFWVWAVSLSLILCGAAIWTFSHSRLAQQIGRSTASTPAPTTTNPEPSAPRTTTGRPGGPSFGGPAPRTLTLPKKPEAIPSAEPARIYPDREKERDERENEQGDPRVDPQEDTRDLRDQEQQLFENVEPQVPSDDTVRAD